MIDQHRQAFRDEASELLTELESSLLELEETPDDMELIGRVFRAMHTIKGSGAMFGFDAIAAFTHDVETVFDLVRNGRLAVSKDLVNLSLAARDQIKAMLEDAGEEGGDAARRAEILAGFKALVPASAEGAPASQPLPEAAEPAVAALVTYRLRFAPLLEIFLSGTNPINLLNELRELGNCAVVAQNSVIPPLEAMDPEHCYVRWDVVLTTGAGANAIRDVFIFAEDQCELKLDIIDEEGRFDGVVDYKKLGFILMERGEITHEEMMAVLARQKRFGQLAVEAGLVSPDQVESALVEQRHVKVVRQERQGQDAVSSIRVPAERLDQLVDLVGELVTVQARLSQLAIADEEEVVVAVAEEVERLTAELRDNVLNIRMLPIGTAFGKFRRLVRDLAGELGKEIEMTTAGEETELDKTVIERLNDPLVHLIRNSIDHGIESPAAREAAGKPRQGTLHLSAVHSGDSVLITIADDGGGLDREAIRAKAVEKGLIQASAELSDKEIFSQIFAPGFSTARQITSVSGRGVGMDVVKRAIDALRGSIEIASRPGAGTTITVRIPLTLAIIESLLVKVGDDRFVIPLNIVDECVELTRAAEAAAHGRQMADVRGHVVPYIPLREKFAMAGEPPEIQQIVITEVEGRRVGFVVDHVIGEHQTVIKSLGRIYKNVEGVSGATILGDGAVALILDVNQIIRAAERESGFQ